MISFPVFSQSGTTHHQQTWTQYYLNYSINNQWKLFTDAGIRFENGYANHFQSFVLPSVRYAITANLRLGAGYAYFFNDDNSGYEHRPHQDLFWNIPIASTQLKTRFRFEQRYFFTSTTSFIQLRYRFRLGWEESIYKTPHWDFHADLSNEILLCTGEKVAYNNIDQNWVYVGLRAYAHHFVFLLGYQFTAIPGQEANTLKLMHIIRQGIRYHLG